MKSRRKGFSLIELLIVVAIIAALVGVAVPFFQDNLQQAQQTKAKQDIDTIRNSISLHDAQNRPLTGTSFAPLLGRYLQEIPKDPWGNDYMLDASVGIVISYGADSVAGGTGGDLDISMRYKSDLAIQRAQLKGTWGKPNQGTEVIFTMTKPLMMHDTAAFLSDCNLLRNSKADDNPEGAPIALVSGDTTDSLNTFTNGGTYVVQNWTVVSSDNEHKNGIMRLRQNDDLSSMDTQIWTATMTINMDLTDADGNPADLTAAGLNFPNSGAPTETTTPLGTATGTSLEIRYGISERYYDDGPLNPDVYGYQAANYFSPPISAPPVDGENRGVKIERY